MTNAWAADCPISMPAPLDPSTPPMVDMGGFCFTVNGIAHALDAATHETLTSPTYGPPLDPSKIIYTDGSAEADTDTIEYF